MKLEEAKLIAERVKSTLALYCDRIEIAGSIRRQKPIVNDIDLVIIEKPDAVLNLTTALFTMGVLKINGPDIKRLYLPNDNITIDIYIATPLNWSTLSLIRTGSKENNIRLCSLARRKGWHLEASGGGLCDEDGNRIAGETEESIYQALGFPIESQRREMQCVHRFQVDGQNIGTCSLCGEVRQFPWDRKEPVIVLNKGDTSTSQVSEKEEAMKPIKKRHKYYEDNKEAIIADSLA